MVDFVVVLEAVPGAVAHGRRTLRTHRTSRRREEQFGPGVLPGAIVVR